MYSKSTWQLTNPLTFFTFLNFVIETFVTYLQRFEKTLKKKTQAQLIALKIKCFKKGIRTCKNPSKMRSLPKKLKSQKHTILNQKAQL